MNRDKIEEELLGAYMHWPKLLKSIPIALDDLLESPRREVLQALLENRETAEVDPIKLEAHLRELGKIGAADAVPLCFTAAPRSANEAKSLRTRLLRSHQDPNLLLNFPVASSGTIQNRNPRPPISVIEGIVGRGEKLIISGASKAGKSWALLGLAHAVCNGANWMGQSCRKGRVLFLNFEIGESRMAERLRSLDKAGMPLEGVSFLNLRGATFSWSSIVSYVRYLASSVHFSLIVLDPIYKLLGDTPENDNTAVAAMLAEVERIAYSTGSAVAFAHHFSKGNKSGVESIDRMSGAGAFARDPDAIISLTSHDEDNCYTVEATVRNYPKPEKVVVRFEFPTFVIEDNFDPERLKKPHRGGHNRRGGPETVVEVLAEGGNLPGASLAKALQDSKCVTERTAYNWMEKAEEKGLAENLSGLWTLTSEGEKGVLPKQLLN